MQNILFWEYLWKISISGSANYLHNYPQRSGSEEWFIVFEFPKFCLLVFQNNYYPVIGALVSIVRNYKNIDYESIFYPWVYCERIHTSLLYIYVLKIFIHFWCINITSTILIIILSFARAQVSDAVTSFRRYFYSISTVINVILRKKIIYLVPRSMDFVPDFFGTLIVITNFPCKRKINSLEKLIILLLCGWIVDTIQIIR